MAMDLAVLIYELTKQFPRDEVYGLTAQMRRASVSVASNIAEGSARSTKRDFRHFVITAKGSVCELQTQILLAERLKYATPEKLQEVRSLAAETARMLSGLSAFLQADSKLTNHAKHSSPPQKRTT